MPAWLLVVGYGTAFYSLSLSLNQLPLRIAYAIRQGVGTALIALLGCVLFRQALNPGAVIGILLSVAGVGIINLSADGRGPWWAIFALVAATRPAQRNTRRLLSV